jgi:hypothetical protein
MTVLRAHPAAFSPAPTITLIVINASVHQSLARHLTATQRGDATGQTTTDLTPPHTTRKAVRPQDKL